MHFKGNSWKFYKISHKIMKQIQKYLELGERNIFGQDYDITCSSTRENGGSEPLFIGFWAYNGFKLAVLSLSSLIWALNRED